MENESFLLVDRIKAINIFLSPKSKVILKDFHTDKGSPLSESEMYSNDIDVALFIFFNALGPKNKDKNLMDKIKKTPRAEIAKKAGELPIRASKIEHIGEILIATYLGLNPKIDLLSVMGNDDPEIRKQELSSFTLGLRQFIENTIECYGEDVKKRIYDPSSTNPIRTAGYFVNELKKDKQVDF